MLSFDAPLIVIGGTAVVYIVLIFLSLRRRGFNSWLHGLFFLYLLIGSIWAIGKSLTIARGLVPQVSVYASMIVTDALAILPVLLAVLTLLFLARPGAKWVGLVGAIWAVFVALVDNNAFEMQEVLREYLRLPTAAQTVNTIIWAGWAGFTGGALVLAVWDYVRTQRPLHRNRILYWLAATLFIGVGEGLTMLPTEATAQVGAFTRMLGVLLMAYAALSYYLPSVRNVIRRGMAVTLITLVSAGLLFGSFVLLQTAQPMLPAGSMLVGMGVLSVLLAIIIQPLRRWVSHWIDRILIGEGYDPARALRDYSAAITNILDLDTLVTIAIGTISEALEVRRGALLLTTERDDGRIEVRIVPGMGEVAVQTAEFDPNSPILAHLHQKGLPLSQYEIDILPEFRAAPAWERAWLEKLNMELYVPIRRQSLLVGILALGSKTGDVHYSTQDLNVLSTLADQTAVALQNARLVSDLKALNVEITALNDSLMRANRRLAKLDAAKTHFIQIASHELRTPLTQVRGYADIMADVVQSGAPTPAQMAQISQGISRATMRLEEIISVMLDVAEIDVQSLSLHYTSLTIASVMRMALENYQAAFQQRRQSLAVEGLEDLPPVQGDVQRLCQAFSNVIGNCIKYTPDGGSIRVSGWREERSEDGAAPREYVHITIADTGIGIDPDDQELIFDKFYRVSSPDLHSTGSTKFKGAGPGLGLSVTRGIVEAHGGKIWVESPGYDEERCPGSTFHIVLPTTPPERAAADASKTLPVAA